MSKHPPTTAAYNDEVTTALGRDRRTSKYESGGGREVILKRIARSSRGPCSSLVARSSRSVRIPVSVSCWATCLWIDRNMLGIAHLNQLSTFRNLDILAFGGRRLGGGRGGGDRLAPHQHIWISVCPGSERHFLILAVGATGSLREWLECTGYRYVDALSQSKSNIDAGCIVRRSSVLVTQCLTFSVADLICWWRGGDNDKPTGA